MSTLRWVLTAAGKSKRSICLLTAVRCTMAAIAVGYALLMQASIDAAVAGDAQRFWAACTLFAASLIFQAVLAAASKYLSESSQAHVDNALRSDVAGSIIDEGRIPDNRHTGDAMSVLTSDIAAVRDGLVNIAPEALSLLLRALAAMALLWTLAPSLVVLFIGAGALCAGASLLMRAWLKRLHATSQQAEANMRSYLQEVLESLVVVSSFGAEESIKGRLSKQLGEHLEARLGLAKGRTASSAAFNMAMQLSYLAGFAWGCYGILKGTVTYGTLMAVVQLVGQIRAPFAGFSGLFAQYTAMIASGERLRALKGKEPGARIAIDPTDVRNLTFDSVRYGYTSESEPVLADFSMNVQRGEFIAITGPSGVGKSTTLMLTLGMDSPQTGSVKINGGTSSVDAAQLAAGIFAYVPQGNMLMSGTIREVVCLGRGNVIDESALLEAARTAQALDFIEALPHGFGTELGERGTGLSEGQMQRLAVARAIYSNAPVLLLDEATSALDETTERNLLSALRKLDRTVIIVTHRPAALGFCDRVVRMG